MPQALFGAPLGFLAAEDQANKTAMTQVNAQHILTEIASEPGKRELRAAQTREQNALAGEHEAKVADLQAMAVYEGALRKATEAAGAQGREATIDDVKAAGKPASVTDPQRKLYDFMVNAGAPQRLTAPLAKQIADNSEKESIGAYRAGQAREIEEKQRLASVAKIGQYARAAMASPEGYAQMRMLATESEKDLPPPIKRYIDSLPQDWATGRKKLELLYQQTLSVKDGISIEQRERELAIRKQLADASSKRATAVSELTGVRKKLIEVQTNWLEKEGGASTVEAAAAREASTAASLQHLEAERIKVHPKLPGDPKNWVVGKSYTLADGSVGTPVIGADGKVKGFNEILPPLPKRAPPKSADEIRKDREKKAKAAGVPVSVIEQDDEDVS